MHVKHYGNNGDSSKGKTRSHVSEGILFCNTCNRWYPIDEGILIMLPDNLIKKDQEEFLSKFKNIEVESFNDNNKTNDVLTYRNNDDNAGLKKNEMEKRDEQAPIYHTYGHEFHDKTERSHFLRLQKPGEHDLVVELGCGTGRITKDFAGAAGHYIAVDFSKKSLELLKRTLGKDILLIKGDVCKLPIIDEVTSCVISAQVFEHIPGREEQVNFIKELNRILEIGGKAVLTIYNYNIEKRWQRGLQKKGFHDHKIYYEHFTSRELRKLFQEDFELLEMRGINCYVPKISKIKNNFLKEITEQCLSRTYLHSYLGDIWLLALKKEARSIA